ncbi:MAG: hypothetical protein K8S20_11960 [Chloroflexi bacterium]|nr:hypothetical protein [Chloroflexota bacterium]
MTSEIELLEFLEISYRPDHASIPGCISIVCLIREWGLNERKKAYTFQYNHNQKKLYFIVYPTRVQLPVADAENEENAIEQAKQFLTQWLGGSMQFRLKTAEEIRRLEAKKM